MLKVYCTRFYSTLSCVTIHKFINQQTQAGSTLSPTMPIPKSQSSNLSESEMIEKTRRVLLESLMKIKIVSIKIVHLDCLLNDDKAKPRLTRQCYLREEKNPFLRKFVLFFSHLIRAMRGVKCVKLVTGDMLYHAESYEIGTVLSETGGL